MTGGDARGAMYGALDFAEQLELTGKVSDKEEQPSLAVRALKFNVPLPGTGYLSEEDLANNQWFWSMDYWRKFLDMAARNRYNAITFWSAHPYDRMVRVPKYPEATDVPAAELDRNIAFFRQLFQMAADRGLDTYLVTWNIHVSRAFAAAAPRSGGRLRLAAGPRLPARVDQGAVRHLSDAHRPGDYGRRAHGRDDGEAEDGLDCRHLFKRAEAGGAAGAVHPALLAGGTGTAGGDAGIGELSRPGLPGHQVQRRAHVLVGAAARARPEMGGAGARTVPPAVAPAQRRRFHPALGRPRFRARNGAPHGGPGYGRIRGGLGGGRAGRGPDPHGDRESAHGLAIQIREALVPLHALGTRGLQRGRAGIHLAGAFPAALRSGGR